MKVKLFIYIILLSKMCHSQISDFEFQICCNDSIVYNKDIFIADTINLFPYSEEYLMKIVELSDKEIFSRYFANPKYVFPLRIKYRNNIYLSTFTASGLYACNINDMSEYYFQQYIFQTLKNNDTIDLINIPIRYVGSSNYIIAEKIDVEFILFRKNKFMFLNFFFKEDESGTYYNYIGLDNQIPLVVSQLYNWGILVNDGAGSDQHSTIYITKENYPNLEEYTINDSERLFICEWMNIFRDKYVYKNKLIKRDSYSTRKDKWWK